MKIKKIILNNFRIYSGENEIQFSANEFQNISLISGNNGYGKTSFLTSLVWCLYGKLMAEVDEKYKSEILESGGYDNFCKYIFNKRARIGNINKISSLERKLEGNQLSTHLKTELKSEIDKLNSFSVSIELQDVLLPAFPSKCLTIKRSHNIVKGKETIEILIDGNTNELSNEVGPDIFINDFILPKEIAKFFFFDAEKIVSLAETKTTDEKRKLSKAYSEVLGIKKYVDLKTNLENLRIRLRKKAAKGKDKERLTELTKAKEESEKMISHYQEKVINLVEDLNQIKLQSDHLQEKLIREGTTITVTELKQLKQIKQQLAERNNELKNRVKEMTDLAPFAIASKLMEKAKKQLEKENSQKQIGLSKAFLNQKVASIKVALTSFGKENKLDKKILEGVTAIISENLSAEQKVDFIPLLDYSSEQENSFNAVYSNLKGSYKESFTGLAREFKLSHNEYLRVIQKLKKAESKENDSIVKEIRSDKDKLDGSITEKEGELIELKAKLIALTNELNSISKLISEITKRLDIEERARLKDETTSRLIMDLENFITNLKIQKKGSLEERLKKELNKLMHKTDFVNNVHVIVEGDLIDFELYDVHDELIKKEGLSKGEQQLFATALLQSLVDESSIEFPVFIDSPLQKLDKEHAENIIKDFYPYVSEQVILFPLLEKELAEKEYQWLLPKISDVYLIKNGEKGSYFEAINSKDVFKQLKKKEKHVYEH